MAQSFSLSPPALFARLFSDKQLIVLDIRVPDDLALDAGWLPAAHRLSFEDLEGQLALVPPNHDVVVICQGGLKLSQGVAARLGLQGRRAGYLVGGIEAWRAAGMALSELAPELWVTDGADVAAHWLATRLLPQPHEILVVEPDQIGAAADRFEGQPLPSAEALLARFDRPLHGLQSALDFAVSPAFSQLRQGGARGFGLLDAWTLGAEELA